MIDGTATKAEPATVDRARSLVSRLETQCPQCYLQRATCRAIASDYAGAELEVESALKVIESAKLQGRQDAQLAEYAANETLGDIYYLAARYREAAIAYHRGAVAENPMQLMFYRKMGRAYEKAGLYLDAERSWMHVIQLSHEWFQVVEESPPQSCRADEVWAYLALVKMQLATKQCAKAADTLKDAKKFNPVCARWKVGEWKEDIRCTP